MLSYMLPAEDKPPLIPNKTHLQLNLEAAERAGSRTRPLADPDRSAETVKTVERVTNGGGAKTRTIIKSQSRGTPVSVTGSTTISTDSSVSSISSADLPVNTPTEKSRTKLCVNGVKTSLKRVSFGSSKGSMVETLIFESPLAEEQETSPLLETPSSFSLSIDSETPESKKVRVKFFESDKPLLLPSPDSADEFPLDASCDVAALMTSHSPVMDEHVSSYNRQTRTIRLTGYVSSTESGWDNPFRPDGDLSREADEMVELIKEGKPITPTPGSAAPQLPYMDEADSSATSAPGDVSAAAPKQPAGANGNAAPSTEKVAGAVEVQRGTVGQPIDASQVEHVNIKKKPKCKCCVIQ